MKYRIYYFSATGNTQKAVELITERLKKEGHEVELLRINRKSRPLPGTPDRMIFAFPTLSWVPPILVQRFVRRLPNGKLEDGSRIKTAVISADGGGGLQSPDHLKRMLMRRGYDVFLTARASFPDNWLQFVPGPDEKHKQEAIANGEKMTADFIEKLIKEEREYYKVPFIHVLWSRLVGALFAILGRRFMGKMFIADESCTSCRLCERSCPVKAIDIVKRKKARPYWKINCESCNRCINICPEKAIVSSNMRIGVLVAAITAAIIIALGLYNGNVKPWLVNTIPNPFLWFANTLLVTIVVLFAHWFAIGPFDRFFLRYFQRIPGIGKVFEKGFNKKFLRYTMTGYKAPREDI